MNEDKQTVEGDSLTEIENTGENAKEDEEIMSLIPNIKDFCPIRLEGNLLPSKRIREIYILPTETMIEEVNYCEAFAKVISKGVKDSLDWANC